MGCDRGFAGERAKSHLSLGSFSSKGTVTLSLFPSLPRGSGVTAAAGTGTGKKGSPYSTAPWPSVATFPVSRTVCAGFLASSISFLPQIILSRDSRFVEPYAGNLHLRICAGGRPQGRSLPQLARDNRSGFRRKAAAGTAISCCPRSPMQTFGDSPHADENAGYPMDGGVSGASSTMPPFCSELETTNCH